MVNPMRRKLLKTGAAATVIAAAPRVLAQSTAARGAAPSFFERGPVRIHYQEVGAGVPLLLIAGGGLNSTIAGLTSPFDAIGEFKAEYRCIAVDGDVAVATGSSSYKDSVDGPVVRVYDNCFVLRFDSEARCREFTEWFIQRKSP